jgi:acyl-CoA synthetase (AMP-forming)/AMP-acid ligase II
LKSLVVLQIVKDAFRKGDTYFNTGDLLTRDYWGWFFWSDRTGDTFRWKGEVRRWRMSTLAANGIRYE